MYNYLKPTRRDSKPEIFVFHVGTNDLFLIKSPQVISEDIVTLVESIKTENNKIIISGIVCCAYSFKEKFDQLNNHRGNMCRKRDTSNYSHKSKHEETLK